MSASTTLAPALSNSSAPPEAFSLGGATFRYDPFPVACAQRVFLPDAYERLVGSWPSTALFKSMPELGKKFSLSEVNNAGSYHDFIASSPVWRAFYIWIKSDCFVRSTLDILVAAGIDLGLAEESVSTTNFFSPRLETLRSKWLGAAQKRIGHRGVLRSRFEFSMLPADGGHILPHTDHQRKLITIVLSMVRPGEWSPAWGGGTAMERPKDLTKNFNFVNRQLAFEDMETLETYPFEPNQAVLFVKTFNSHHSVHPMTAKDSDVMRRTITINIERTT